MARIDDQMTLIHEIDPWASIHKSTSTGGWYVSSRIELKMDGMLRSGGWHAPSPASAVSAFVRWLKWADGVEGRVLVRIYAGTRTEWVWNGKQFVQINCKAA